MLPFILLVGFLATPIFSGDWDDADDFENVSLSSTVTAASAVSWTTDATANEADVAPSYTPTTQERPTPKTLPEGEVSPSPSAPGPTASLSEPTAGAKVIVMTTPEPQAAGAEWVGYIILFVIIVIALLAGLVCYVARSRGRRYSVDLTSRSDEARIPLSTVEPQGLVAPVTSNGLQFEGTESSAQESQEPEVEQKAGSENVAVDASGNCTAPTADPPEAPSERDVPEQSAPAPVAPSTQEKTDDDDDEGGEGAASNQTSAEALKESDGGNENNSNSGVRPQRGARDVFWDVPPDNMV